MTDTGELSAGLFVPPGHFYSPLPDLEDLAGREAEIFRSRSELPGIDVRAPDQLALLRPFRGFYAEQPFGDVPTGDLRYGFANDYFSYGDGLVLYGMLRWLRPRRIVEVGSGWSTAVMLDVNEHYLGGAVDVVCIEPYPDRLRSLVRPGDLDRLTVLSEPLARVPAAVFAELKAGDVLFIDSTHVAKTGSDVNDLLLEIVPTLSPGVHVHVHDIFWPFEYPKEWVFEGRGWTEAYLLRALLVNSSCLRISWFNSYLSQHHHGDVADAMPLWARNSGGSIWLQTQ